MLTFPTPGSTAQEGKGGLRAALPLLRRRIRAVESGIGRCAGQVASREFKVLPPAPRALSLTRTRTRTPPPPSPASDMGDRHPGAASRAPPGHPDRDSRDGGGGGGGGRTGRCTARRRRWGCWMWRS